MYMFHLILLVLLYFKQFFKNAYFLMCFVPSPVAWQLLRLGACGVICNCQNLDMSICIAFSFPLIKHHRYCQASCCSYFVPLFVAARDNCIKMAVVLTFRLIIQCSRFCFGESCYRLVSLSVLFRTYGHSLCKGANFCCAS